MLGTTLGVKEGKLGVKEGNQVTANSLTAFGEPLSTSPMEDSFFTGKPHVGEMGYAFLFRAYRADQGKWQTADPLGYPDGWNNFAYVKNQVSYCIDWLGCVTQELFVASGNPYIKLENRNPSTHIHNEKNCNTSLLSGKNFSIGTR